MIRQRTSPTMELLLEPVGVRTGSTCHYRLVDLFEFISSLDLVAKV